MPITHTWCGDLRGLLRAPSEVGVTLHNRSGGDLDDLIRTYRSTDEPLLHLLVGTPAKGHRTLKVQDLVEEDTSLLQKWGIGVTFTV